MVRILIDGRSGSGKTELATAMVAAWPDAQLVRLDDLYPGWDGLDAGSAAVPVLLREHRWRSWDWAEDRAGRWHDIDPARPLLVEGVGALSAASRALADYAVWVELADGQRKRRALERDGGSYEPHWDRWAAQEERFLARERPSELADEIVDGSDIRPAAERLVARIAGASQAQPSSCNCSSSMP